MMILASTKETLSIFVAICLLLVQTETVHGRVWLSRVNARPVTHHATTSFHRRLPLSFVPRGGGGGGSLEEPSGSSAVDDDDEDYFDDVLAAEENNQPEAALGGGGDDDDEEEEAEVEPKGAPEPEDDEKEEEEAEPALVTEEETDSANVDRMDYADAYDEEVDTLNDDQAEQEEVAQGGATLADVTGIESSGETPSKIPLVSEITPAMRDTLVKQLKYKAREVKRMRPEIAAVVVAKQLQRPQEGLPPHWLVDEPKKGGALGRTKSIVLSILAVAVAVVGGTALSSSGSGEYVWDASSSSTPAVTTTTYYEPPPVTSVGEKEEPEPAEKEETLFAASSKPAAPVEHEHSLRPGERAPTEPIDETALDKFLTKVEKGLGSLFGR